ncbi:MAG: hypothetical protein Q7R57_08685 [Dehalococcoidales bacterium]|nr:hypothetical protein [Dehalococcoidales bacterium]
MVTTTLGGRGTPLTTGQILTVLGAVTAGFSIVAGLLFVFAFPAACTFLGGLGIVILAGLFVAGMITFGIGRFLVYRQNRHTAS